MARPTDLVQGTLDLPILTTLSIESKHGWAIAKRSQQISREIQQVQQGSLYPALHRQVGERESTFGSDQHGGPGGVICARWTKPIYAFVRFLLAAASKGNWTRNFDFISISWSKRKLPLGCRTVRPAGRPFERWVALANIRR